MKQLIEDNKEHILGVVPQVSVMKMVDRMYTVAKECHSTDHLSIYIHIAPLSHIEVFHFQIWLDAISITSNMYFRYEKTIKPDQISALLITTICSDYLNVAKLLAEQTEVTYMQPKTVFTHSNYWSRGVMESGSYDNVGILLSKGLTGQNQVIGIADTGLDLTSNYFYDNVSITYNSNKMNTLHRKIVSYWSRSVVSPFLRPCGDFSDIAGGHGSHVAGIAAGKAYEDYGDFHRFNGIAPDAKIAFFDISMNDSTANTGLVLPTDVGGNLKFDMFEPMYNISGARIFSNSWGGFTDGSYSSEAVQVDDFMFSYPDALVLFANGNEGDPYTHATSREFSVDSPSVFKNGLSIGAGLTDAQSWFSIYQGHPDSRLGVDVVAAFSSGTIRSF
jgi:subtilisin family serine protease